MERIGRIYSSMKSRCKHHKLYAGRGIKCLITKEELEFLWKRDKAHKLEHPSIDRIDPNGHYELSNCRWIEVSENASRARIRSTCSKGHSLDFQKCYIRVTNAGYLQRNCAVCHREKQRRLKGCKERYKGAKSYKVAEAVGQH